MSNCQHKIVTVTYRHPHGDIVGASVAQLRATPPDQSRPIMTLASPQCADCGCALSRSQIIHRIVAGGDLHDPRFRFVA